MANSEYMLKRYHERRADAIVRLGGKCVVCGATEDLQLDHINRDEKSFPIGQMWSVSKERYETELSKCQLLCWTCHKAKTQWEIGRKAAKGTHGTISSYRYCKCKLCRKAYSDYWKEYAIRSGKNRGRKTLPLVKTGRGTSVNR